MNNDKNKKISNNYKDYKYVYTGYDEFIKKHHLDKKEIKEEKEQIIHDHRNVFDFNNPNQHTHDYSFDFSQQEKTQKTTGTYKDKYGNVYNKKTNSNTYYTKNNYTQTTTHKNTIDPKPLKTLRNILIIFLLAPIVINILIAIIPFFIFLIEDSYETSTSTESYLVPIEKLCDAIEDNNYNLVSKYILANEKNYYNTNDWKKIIYNYDYYGIANYDEERTCNLKKTISPSTNELDEIEEDYQQKYNASNFIENAYKFEIKVTGNFHKQYVVTTVKIDGQWYLFTIN